MSAPADLSEEALRPVAADASRKASTSPGARIALVLLGNVFPPAAAFITSPLLAHTLGASGRGLVSGATAPMLLMLGAATLGLPEAVTYALAAGASRRTALKRAVLWTTAAGVVATAVIVVSAGALSAGDGAQTRLTALVALAITPGLVVGVIRGAAAGVAAWGLVTLDRIVQAVFRLGALVVLAVIGRLTVESAALTIAVGAVVGVFAYIPLMPALRHSAVPGRDVRLLHFGLRNWSGSLSGILVSRVDQSLMVPLASSFQLGLYAVAVSLSELPLVFNNAVRDVTFAAESERADGERIAMAARISTAMTAFAAVVVGVLSAVFMTVLFGEDFRSAVGVVAVLLVAVVAGNPGSIAGMGLSARGRPGLRSLSLSIGLVIDLVALVALAPLWGAMGAAVATLLANASCAVLNLLWLRRSFGIPMRSFLGWRTTDGAVVVSIVGGVARRLRRAEA